jgi:hypothetical protein
MNPTRQRVPVPAAPSAGWALITPAVNTSPVSLPTVQPRPRPGIITARTFTVLAHATSFTMMNVGGKGIGPGDYVAEQWALHRGGAPAG